MKKRKWVALAIAFSMLLGQTVYAQEYTVQADQTEMCEIAETEVNESVMEETDIAETEVEESVIEEETGTAENRDDEMDLATVEESIQLLQDGDMVSQYFGVEDQDAVAMFSADENTSEWKRAMKEKFRESIRNLATDVEVEDLGLYYTSDIMEEIGNVLQETIDEGYFYVANQFSISYYTQSELIGHVYIDYKAIYQDSNGNPDEALIRKDEALVNAQINRALESVQNADSDLEKALLLHDFIVRECDYDYKGAYGGEDASKHPHMYDVYGTLVLGSAVCSGYASAYSILLQKCGIESYVVTSDTMNHAWNLVKIDGHWYHIDTTWDDPVFTNGQTWLGLTNADTADEGFINHTYFMCSDTEIKALEHEGWDEVENADQSGAYDAYLFKTTPRASFAKIGQQWYMFNLSSGSLYSATSLLAADATSLIDNYSGNYGWGYENNFYTNTEESVYRWNAQAKTNVVVWEPSDENQRISEMSIKNGYLICVLLDADGTTERVKTDVHDLNESDPSYVQQGTCGGNLKWYLDKDGVLAIRGTGAMQQYTYKKEVPWYSHIEDVQSVVIEDGVTSISDYAFYGMTNLKTIQIPEGVKTIGAYAFKNDAALAQADLPSTLTKLGESAFYGCTDLSEITIPEGMYTIWSYTFKNCTSLSEVTLPSTLIKMDEAAFYGCKALTSFNVPDNVAIIGTYCFKNCSNLEEIHLPKKLAQVRESAFYATGLKKVELPSDTASVGKYAFKNCTALKSIQIPESVDLIDESAFYGCSGLTTVTIPVNVKTIGNYAFSRCSGLKEIDFTGDAPTIDSYSFSRVTANAKYPAGNTTWTADKRQNYGGQLTWSEK